MRSMVSHRLLFRGGETKERGRPNSRLSFIFLGCFLCGEDLCVHASSQAYMERKGYILGETCSLAEGWDCRHLRVRRGLRALAILLALRGRNAGPRVEPGRI